MFRPDYCSSYQPLGLKLLLTSVAPKIQTLSERSYRKCWNFPRVKAVVSRWSFCPYKARNDKKGGEDVADVLFIVMDLSLQNLFFFFSGKDVVYRRKTKPLILTFLFKWHFFYFFLLFTIANISLQKSRLEQQRNLQPWRREDWVWLTRD